MQIERSDLTAKVFRVIRDDITAGKYEPGTPLQLPQLVKELGVSQTPIREALLRLAEKEYLEKSNSRSYVVRSLTKQQLFKISEIRADLEAKIIKDMILNKQSFQLEVMRDIYDRQSDELFAGNYEQALILNRDFHGHYLGLSNIPQAASFIENICVILGPVLHGLKYNRYIEDKEEHFHNQMLLAIEAGDGDRAAQAVRNDVMENAKQICRLM